MDYSWYTGICVIVITLMCEISGAKFRRVCYFAGWAPKRQVEEARMKIDDIDPYLCTHLIYAFANIDAENKDIISVDWDDLSTDTIIGSYQKFNNLKSINTRLKTLISIGGAKAGPWPFEQITKNVQRTDQFAKNVVKFLIKQDFDGLDVDWEFPRRADKFTTLMQSLRDAFLEEKKKSGTNLLLTAAVGVGEKHISYGYNVPHIARLVDFFNVMTYDFHGPWDKFTGGNAPLFTRHHDKKFNHRNSVEYAVTRWTQAGAPRKKIVMGINFQARTYILAKKADNRVGSAAHGPGNPGPLTNAQGTLAYFEVCNTLADGAIKRWDRTQKFAYAVKGNSWISYESPSSVSMKTKWMMNQNLGGIMMWSIDMDDYTGDRCDHGSFPLTSIVMDTITGKTSRTFDFSKPPRASGYRKDNISTFTVLSVVLLAIGFIHVHHIP